MPKYNMLSKEEQDHQRRVDLVREGHLLGNEGVVAPTQVRYTSRGVEDLRSAEEQGMQSPVRDVLASYASYLSRNR